ncbi:hypothetical protein MATL_G00121880 [Megalops atlanticus]|uniref:BTB and CNC-like protein 1 n=1 Tax=Megalops atlanticus TaxID=7932 RepID=A0A9D3PXV4_MEGAT|nr:hypothetical protein MATL_G00121880 [Megalops atlanticus]
MTVYVPHHRQNDVLCDVTVVVENKSYRAHRSVLASCSDYFHNRVTSHAGQGLVIALPDEVTAEGFDALLQFAYTAKLLFTKENILEIHNCATILGFHNLEKACFDFLIPKFFDSGKRLHEIQRKVCCKTKCCKQKSLPNSRSNLDEAENGEEHSGAESPDAALRKKRDETQCPSAKVTSELTEACGPNCLEKDVQTDYSLLCPKYRKFQMAYGKDRFCLEDYGPQMSPLSPALTSEGCASPCVPCTSNENNDPTRNLCARHVPEAGSACEKDVTPAANCLPCSPAASENSNATGFGGASDLGCDQPVETPVVASDCCAVGPVKAHPLNNSVATEGGDVVSEAGNEGAMEFEASESALSSLVQKEGGGDRTSVEREVAEHLAKGFWPDPCPSQAETFLLDPEGQSVLGKATDFHWLKQLDLSSSTGDCPFLRELGEEVQLPECEGVSQPEKSPYISSINSGDDSDCDTEGDSEAYNIERAREVQLPFPVEQISSLSRNDFQHTLRLHNLTREQLDFVHDVRRRSKNRIAARRCRKRKLDCILNLECEIDKLKSEKEKLMQEQNQLKLRKGETLQSLTALCHKVCSEATLSPDQLEFLAKFSSPDCPASLLMTPTPSPNLSIQDQGLPTGVSMDACPSEDPSPGETLPTPQPALPSGSSPAPPLLETADCPAPAQCDPCPIVDIPLDMNSQCPAQEESNTTPPIIFD